jgi:hypothetical protein
VGSERQRKKRRGSLAGAKWRKGKENERDHIARAERKGRSERDKRQRRDQEREMEKERDGERERKRAKQRKERRKETRDWRFWGVG